MANFINLRNKSHSFLYLNSSQFLGIVNDNIIKLNLIYFLIDILGTGQTHRIISMISAFYILPLIIFSSFCGHLADRFSKRNILVIAKAAEMLLSFCYFFVFEFKSVFFSYLLLFFTGLHTALIGPSKYAIIPEIVEKKNIPRANSLLISLSYLSIIIGVFLGSLINQITNKNYPLIAFISLLLAFLGFLFSVWIPKTPIQDKAKKLTFNFFYEILHSLNSLKTRPFVIFSLFGSAFFLFIGAFLQLNMIPFAMQHLNMTEVAGGYLFLASSLGIAVGSLLVNKMMKNQINLFVPVVSYLCIACLLLVLGLGAFELTNIIVFLFLLGLLGGFVVTPFETYIQLYVSESNRGKVWGVAGFLSFSHVLLAAFILFLLGDVAQISPKESFLYLAVIVFVVFIVFLRILFEKRKIPFNFGKTEGEKDD
ncbi:MAG: MFS transporter [Rhabdochlamydiaceae bacterium]